MSLSSILAYLSGPAVGSAISYVLDQWSPWHDWKPADKLGFDAKAALVTIGSLGLGFVAYLIAVSVPAATISAIDPYVTAAFPLLTFIAVQLWHAFINKRLNTVTITASALTPGTVTATAKTSGAAKS